MPVYHLPNGLLSKFPTTKNYALSIKSPFYNDGVKCKVCNQMSVKYTHNDACRFCFMNEAVHFYNLHVGSDLVYVDAETGVAMAKMARGPDVEIPAETFKKMQELLEVSRSGEGFTVSTDPCKVKAHYGLKHFGKCYECIQDKKKPSPRKAAMIKGETWYIPNVPCKYCGEIAEKNVHNGNCKGCQPDLETDNRATPDTIMMRESPDLVMSKEDAISYGFKVYRTGKPCKHGHTAWRYVSTGNCIECLRGGE